MDAWGLITTSVTQSTIRATPPSEIRREAHASTVRILEPEREGSEVGNSNRQARRLAIEDDNNDAITHSGRSSRLNRP
jgi:hypothetical protein